MSTRDLTHHREWLRFIRSPTFFYHLSVEDQSCQTKCSYVPMRCFRLYRVSDFWTRSTEAVSTALVTATSIKNVPFCRSVILRSGLRGCQGSYRHRDVLDLAAAHTEETKVSVERYSPGSITFHLHQPEPHIYGMIHHMSMFAVSLRSHSGRANGAPQVVYAKKDSFPASEGPADLRFE